MRGFRVTYGIVTPESAEHSDAESRGYVLPGEWRSDEPGDGMTLREAMHLAYPAEDSGRWWPEVDGRTDHRSGAVETRAIHPPAGITPASYRRITHILGIKES